VNWLLMLAPLLFAAAYCLARAVVDARQRRWWWAITGLVAAIAIITLPLPTHAVKVTIPVSDAD